MKSWYFDYKIDESKYNKVEGYTSGLKQGYFEVSERSLRTKHSYTSIWKIRGTNLVMMWRIIKTTRFLEEGTNRFLAEQGDKFLKQTSDDLYFH